MVYNKMWRLKFTKLLVKHTDTDTNTYTHSPHPIPSLKRYWICILRHMIQFHILSQALNNGEISLLTLGSVREFFNVVRFLTSGSIEQPWFSFSDTHIIASTPRGLHIWFTQHMWEVKLVSMVNKSNEQQQSINQPGHPDSGFYALGRMASHLPVFGVLFSNLNCHLRVWDTGTKRTREVHENWHETMTQKMF